MKKRRKIYLKEKKKKKKTFSETYKTIKVQSWLVYKFTDNNCRLRLFSLSLFKLKTGILSPLTKQVS